MKPLSREHWRNYFREANSDIFDIIDHAIMVAASDCPKEFRMRRDRIAERLFSCKLTRCTGCDRVELAVPGGADVEDIADVGCIKREDDGIDDDDGDDCGFFEARVGSKESKASSSRDDRDIDNDDNDHAGMETNGNMGHQHHQVSNYRYGDAEALTDEIEEESQIVGEVLRIKEILDNSKDESDSVLFESLRRLQLMALSVDTLKATEIGKAVNRLRKHGSEEISHLAQTLVVGWKVLVDEWYAATEAIAGVEGTPDSVNPSVVDEEEGLPSPPLDEGAFFAAQTTTMELSQLFDGLDDDGNPRNGGEFIKNRENRRKPSLENQSVAKRKQQTSTEGNVVAKDNKSHQMKKQEAVVRPRKPSNTNCGPGRPPKLSSEQKVINESNLLRKSDKVSIQKRPLGGPQEKAKCSDEVAVQMKLEATKRKLQERYQQAENAKRQRTIQVMELHDLPKQGLGPKNPHWRPGNHNRHWAHSRR